MDGDSTWFVNSNSSFASGTVRPVRSRKNMARLMTADGSAPTIGASTPSSWGWTALSGAAHSLSSCTISFGIRPMADAVTATPTKPTPKVTARLLPPAILTPAPEATEAAVPAVAPPAAVAVAAEAPIPAIPPEAGIPSAVIPPTTRGRTKARKVAPISSSSPNTTAQFAHDFKCTLTPRSFRLPSVPRIKAGRCSRISEQLAGNPDWPFICAAK
ncbi:hypothetical protein D3C74_14450 [compost metagenome]